MTSWSAQKTVIGVRVPSRLWGGRPRRAWDSGKKKEGGRKEGNNERKMGRKKGEEKEVRGNAINKITEVLPIIG